MRHQTITSFLEAAAAGLSKGPSALVFAEDQIEVGSTLSHLIDLGFGTVALFAPAEMALTDLPEGQNIHRIDWPVLRDGAVIEAVNRVAKAASGAWLHYCYNAEYLFFPFSETRSIRDLVTFQSEERRDTVLTYVIDLYAADLAQHPNGVCRELAYLDQSGYYALGRPDLANHNHPKDRQLDFHGGLRWRFEEHIPPSRRRIDRVGLFRATPEAQLKEDHSFTLEEYNTYACPWHNSATAAICSFRTAKALRSNPGSRDQIASFHWRGSALFDWKSQQLLDLGLIEPGQWF